MTSGKAEADEVNHNELVEHSLLMRQAENVEDETEEMLASAIQLNLTVACVVPVSETYLWSFFVVSRVKCRQCAANLTLEHGVGESRGKHG